MRTLFRLCILQASLGLHCQPRFGVGEAVPLAHNEIDIDRIASILIKIDYNSFNLTVYF